MRADRLVATLLLLQSRASVTAREVAEALEVSERTARRDLEALGTAGVPVFSRQGRGGGWQLVGGARTDLTGLRSPEARALMTMATATGRATAEFTSAMRKLMQALPAPVRDEAERAIDTIVSDDTPWGNRSAIANRYGDEPRDEWIEPIQRAIIDRRQVLLRYVAPRTGPSQRTIDPLGLVIKRGTWYVLAETAAGQRSFRVDRIVGIEVLDTGFEPPVDFDLAQAWDDITTGYVVRSKRITCRAIAEQWAVAALRSLGTETEVLGPRPDGRYDLEVGAWNANVLATQVAGLVGVVELVDPPALLIARLEAIGGELVSRYSATPERSGPDTDTDIGDGRTGGRRAELT